jgi:hypothetical protein
MSAAELPPGMDAFIGEQNETLVKVGSERSESSFGLGCTLGLIPVVAMIAILWAADVLNLISGFITLIMGALVLVGTANLVASAAKRRSIRDMYAYTVKLEIDRYLRENNLTRLEFDRQANRSLPGDAPLRSFMTVPEEPESPPEE